MGMVRIRRVNMGVNQGFMGMRVAVLPYGRIMLVVVMPIVMAVPVVMRQCFVGMRVRVPFHRREVRAEKHNGQRHDKRTSNRLVVHDKRKADADKRGDGIIGAGARRPQLPLRKNIKIDAQPVGEKTERKGEHDVP